MIEAAQRGDAAALDALTDGHIALVKSMVRRFLGRGSEYDDLFQIGCVGLIKAVKNFNLELNVEFSTYAVPMIVGEIRRHFRDGGMLRVGRSIQEQYNAIYKAEKELHALKNGPVTVQEIAERMQLTPEEVVFAMNAMQAPASLQEPIHDDGASAITLGDRIAQEGDMTGEVIDKLLLKQLFQTLEEREKKIMFLRYFREQTQSEIARSMGISQVQVSRLESRIIKKLQSYVHDGEKEEPSQHNVL